MSSDNAGARPNGAGWVAGRGRRRSIVAAILAVPALFLGVGYLRARSFDAGVQPRLSEAAALPVLLPDGSRSTLGRMLEPGRPTVISLWASWCGYCRQEARNWAAFRSAHRSDVNLMLVDVRDDGSTKQDREDFLRTAGLPAQNYVVLDDRAMPSLTGAADSPVPRTDRATRSPGSPGTSRWRLTGSATLSFVEAPATPGPGRVGRREDRFA